MLTAAGLYIHVPFCLKRCRYCDFLSTDRLAGMDDYLAALLQEIARVRDQEAWPLFDTLYFGGGTPALLGARRLETLLAAIHASFHLTSDAQITLEGNPGVISPAFLADLKKIGVNRLQLGVQSFQDDHLKFLGRIHDANGAHAAIRAAQQAGFANLGIDLMYGLPGQGARAWATDLAMAADHDLAHLSCYTLTYEPGTKLYQARAQGQVTPASEARVSRLWQLTHAILARYGYHAYEISNFARRSEDYSRHNLKYWTGAPYLGLGPSAHSFQPPQRFWNTRSIPEYMTALTQGRSPVAGRETLTTEMAMTEALYLGLRTADGIDLKAFEERFGINLPARRSKVVERLRAEKMLAGDATRLGLSIKGMRYLESIAGLLLAD